MEVEKLPFVVTDRMGSPVRIERPSAGLTLESPLKSKRLPSRFSYTCGINMTAVM